MCPDIMSTGFSGAERQRGPDRHCTVAVFAQADRALRDGGHGRHHDHRHRGRCRRLPGNRARRMGADLIVELHQRRSRSSRSYDDRRTRRRCGDRGARAAADLRGGAAGDPAGRDAVISASRSFRGPAHPARRVPRRARRQQDRDHALPRRQERMRRLMGDHRPSTPSPLVAIASARTRSRRPMTMFGHQRDGVLKGGDHAVIRRRAVTLPATGQRPRRTGRSAGGARHATGGAGPAAGVPVAAPAAKTARRAIDL